MTLRKRKPVNLERVMPRLMMDAHDLRNIAKALDALGRTYATTQLRFADGNLAGWNFGPEADGMGVIPLVEYDGSYVIEWKR